MSISKQTKYFSAIIVILMVIAIFSCAFLPSVAYAEISDNYVYDNAWHLSSLALNVKKLYTDIKTKTSIDVSNSTTSKVVVAIIDSGVDKSNPFFNQNSFWKNNKEIAGDDIDNDGNGVIDDINGANFTTSTPNGNFADCMIDGNAGKDWHGTHVAGIVHSIAPNVKLMPVRAGTKKSDGASFNNKNVIKAILYAVDNGADIINMSFGVNSMSFVTSVANVNHNGQSVSMSIADAINYACDKGVLLVAACGNNNKDEAFYPAYLPKVLSVMASNQNKTLWKSKNAGSNYGETYDVLAPGEHILSTLGKGVKGKDAEVNYGFKNGTSMASPYVAGVAALLMSVTGIQNGADLMKYLTDETLLSETNIKDNLVLKDKNLLLDYNAVNKMLDKILLEVESENKPTSDAVSKEYFDNETVTLTPQKQYKGELVWYIDGVPVNYGINLTFIPEKDVVIELKADGFVVETYNIHCKSYSKYIGTIVGSIIGSIGGIILLILLIYVVIKRKQNRKNIQNN